MNDHAIDTFDIEMDISKSLASAMSMSLERVVEEARIDVDLFSTLTEAVERQSAMLLDNLGIVVKFQELPSWAVRSALSRVMFGHGRLGRFWCLWVRPWLMPRWQAQVEAAWERAGDLTRQELLSAVLDQSGVERDQGET